MTFDATSNDSCPHMTMASFARLGAHRRHSLCHGEDVQRRMADEDAFSCFEIFGSEY